MRHHLVCPHASQRLSRAKTRPLERQKVAIAYFSRIVLPPMKRARAPPLRWPSAGTFRRTAVLFVGLPLGPFLKTSPGSSLGRRGVREDPFAGLRPGLFVGLPFFSSDFRSGRLKKHLLVPAWAAEECVKTPSLAFGRNFSLDCRSFRRTSARAVLKNISWFQPGLQRSA